LQICEAFLQSDGGALGLQTSDPQGRDRGAHWGQGAGGKRALLVHLLLLLTAKLPLPSQQVSWQG